MNIAYRIFVLYVPKRTQYLCKKVIEKEIVLVIHQDSLDAENIKKLNLKLGIPLSSAFINSLCKIVLYISI